MGSLTMLLVLYDFFSYPFCSIYMYIHLCYRRVKVEGQIVWLEDELGSSVEEEKEEGG